MQTSGHFVYKYWSHDCPHAFVIYIGRKRESGVIVFDFNISFTAIRYSMLEFLQWPTFAVSRVHTTSIRLLGYISLGSA